MSLLEVSEASSLIQEAAHEEANIIFGAVVDPKLEGEVKVTVIATGFDVPGRSVAAAAPVVQTPVDLQNYAARLKDRSDGITDSGRLSISRRAGLDLPVSPASVGRGIPAQVAASLSELTSDFDSTFDVPAFLRPQR
jgi:cell division protein FtsZ